ncbi:MAG: DUF4367 domain-containing protein [Oscillospiraceae bacterium]|nr:DUF4367 domain-containing protein [Oscillospiraceae bacterium]
MNEAYSVFQRALAESVLEEYSRIPEEMTDESCFTPSFRVWITKMIRKTQRRSWYYVNTTLKKVILIAVILSLLVVTAVAAITTIQKKKEPEIIVNEHEERYGIAFDPEDVTKDPNHVKVCYAPTYIPEGYYMTDCFLVPDATRIVWMNTENLRIIYDQLPIPDDPTNDNWIGIDAEGVEVTDIVIGGYAAKLFSGDRLQIVAWTDGVYLHTLNTDPSISHETMEQIIQSIEPVK